MPVAEAGRRLDFDPSAEYIKKRRVVVTGLGAITPLGLTVPENWKNLIAGETGISEVNFGMGIDARVAGLVRDFDPKALFNQSFTFKDIRRESQSTIFSYDASQEALIDADLLDENWEKISEEKIDPTEISIRGGTGGGGMTCMADVDKKIREGKGLSISDLFQVEQERAASLLTIKKNIQGPARTENSACASSGTVMADAFYDIMCGRHTVLVAIGTESTFGKPESQSKYISHRLFDPPGALSKESKPRKASRPFDKNRSGFVLAEGAGALIFEELEHALARGATIYAEVVGVGESSDAYKDTEPHPEGRGVKKAIKDSIEMANVGKDEPIYVSAHGTGTIMNDPREMKFTREVLDGYNLVAISSTKGATGHPLGAAAAIAAVYTILVLKYGIMPPTINNEDPIEEAEGANIVPNKAQPANICVGVVSSQGFGGQNTAITFRKWPGGEFALAA